MPICQLPTNRALSRHADTTAPTPHPLKISGADLSDAYQSGKFKTQYCSCVTCIIIVKAEVEIPHPSSLELRRSWWRHCVLGSRRANSLESIDILANCFAMDAGDDALDIENPQLDKAAADGDLKQCQALLKQWKQRPTPTRITARHLASALAAAIGGKQPQVVPYLLKQGAVISGNGIVLALGNTDDSFLVFPTFLDNGIICDEVLVRWFLTHGADPNPYGAKAGSTILDVAAANATPTIFGLLISHGARLADSDALHSAAGEREKRPGRVEMMAHLLGLGFDINAMGRRLRRMTPKVLIYAKSF